MKFSTRAEYGLKAMVNLAHEYPRQKNLRTISRQEKISRKYLERLMGKLRKNKLVGSTQGKDGGYFLARRPEGIKAGEIIEALEGSLAPMRCVENFCAQKNRCASSAVWDQVGNQLRTTLYKIKLSDLIKPYAK